MARSTCGARRSGGMRASASSPLIAPQAQPGSHVPSFRLFGRQNSSGITPFGWQQYHPKSYLLTRIRTEIALDGAVFKLLAGNGGCCLCRHFDRVAEGL